MDYEEMEKGLRKNIDRNDVQKAKADKAYYDARQIQDLNEIQRLKLVILMLEDEKRTLEKTLKSISSQKASKQAQKTSKKDAKTPKKG